MTGRLSVRLLGGVEALVDTVAVPISGTKLQALVAMLALGAPHRVATDYLIDELWGEEQPGNPDNALQAKISQARRLLGRDAVVRREPGYQLAVAPEDVDAIQLERSVRLGREAAAGGDHQRACEHYEAALELVRGPPLGDLLDFRFGRVAASRAEELVLAAHEGLADAQLATGRHGDAVGPLMEFVRDHPLRERFHAQLVLALYRCGRQADALRAYQAARTVLLEELGLEPGAELQALEKGVLTHDPSLTGGFSVTPTLPPRTALPGERDLDAWRSSGAKETVAEQLPLVGRDGELETLHAIAAEAMAGRGRVVLLGGEPGIGKTRLAEELSARASGDGVVVVWGRCYDGRGAPAFWPWTQVVQGLLDQGDADELRAALGPDAAELAQIVPDVKEVVADLEPVVPLDPESARFRLYQAITGFVRRLAHERSVMVVLDDLQWADVSSMEVLAFLAGDLADANLLVVATYRDVDPTIGGDLSDTIAELARHRAFRRVDLVGLDERGVAEFLGAAGAEPSDDLVTTLHGRTRGNPFFVTEILRLLPGHTGHPDARAVGRIVPSNVKEVIRHRLLRLPDQTGRALTAASVIGHDFDVSLVASILDIDAGTLLERFEPAIVAGILVDSPEGARRFRFSHGLVHETVYGDLGTGARARMHQRAGEALEARHGDDDGPHLLPLAEHWFHAVPAAPPEKGVASAVRAARWAQAHVAHLQAEEQLHAALELIAGMPSGRDRASLELEVQNELCMLLIVTTSYSGQGLAVAARRTRELCEELDDHALLVPALWRQSIYHMMRGEIAAGILVGEQLLARGQNGDGPPAALLAGHMCVGTLLSQRGSLADARAHLDLAIEMCDAGHDVSLASDVAEEPAVFARAFSGINWWLLGDEVRAVQDELDALKLAAERGPLAYGNLLGLWGAASVAVLRRDTSATLRYTEAAFALSKAAGFAMGGPYGYLGAPNGWARAVEGAVDEGAEVIKQSIVVLQSVGAVYLAPHLYALHADACLMGGRAQEALESVDAGLAIADANGESWSDAELHRLRGEALRALDRSDPRAGEALALALTLATAQGAHGLVRRVEASIAGAS